MFNINKFKTERIDSSKPRPVVLLIHGHLDSADAFILNGEKSIANIIMNQGYDVWLGNTRGNKYSERHLTLDANLDYGYW